MITKTQQYLLSKLPDKIMKNILVIESGCWLWQVNINRNGYGRNYVKGKRHMAHITTYKLLKGAYEEGLLLDHIYCKHRNCCNPTHLSPVTDKVNTHRGKAVLWTKKPVWKYPKAHKLDDLTFLSNLLAY